MLGGAALATAGVTAVTDLPVVVDALIFGCAALLLLLGVRPQLQRRFGAPPPTPTNVAALPGRSALVLEDVGAHQGQVRLDGDVWTARPLDESEVYPAGSTVTVMKIDGATAVVWKGA